MKKYLKIIAVSAILLFLSSCVGEEPNDIGYITAVGIDESDYGFRYTIQFANPTKISGGASEEGGTGGNIAENIVVEAPTLYAALSNANSVISKDLSLAHAKIIIVSEGIAKNGISDIMESIARNNDIRPDIYVAVAESAKEYLEGVKPVLELNPIKYYQLTYGNEKGGPVPHNNAVEFYMSFVSGDSDCALPLAGVASGIEENNRTDAGTEGDKEEEPQKNIRNDESRKTEGGFQSGTREYMPGEAGVEIKNKSETMGLAIFCGDKYVGKMSSEDAEIYNILTCNVKNLKVSFYDGEEPSIPITMSLEEKRAPHITLNRDTKTVNIGLKIESELLSVPKKHGNSKSTDIKAGEMISDAAEEFLNRIYSEIGSDLLGLRGKLKWYFPSERNYKEYVSDFNPREWIFSVTCELSVKRTGMTYYY